MSNKVIDNREEFFKQNPGDYSTQWVSNYINQRPIRKKEIGDENKAPDTSRASWKGKDYWKYDDVKADENIIICPSCSCCWERVRSPGEMDYIIYSDFPKIGKKVGDICPKC